jgi:hypothetical protein
MKRRRRNPKVPTEDCVLLFKPTQVSFDISTRREYRTRDRALIPLLPEQSPDIGAPKIHCNNNKNKRGKREMVFVCVSAIVDWEKGEREAK